MTKENVVSLEGLKGVKKAKEPTKKKLKNELVASVSELQNKVQILEQLLQMQMQRVSQITQGLEGNQTNTANMLDMLLVKNTALITLLATHKVVDVKELSTVVAATVERMNDEREAAGDKTSGFSVVDRAAKKEDVVCIDFVGTIDGKPFPGGTASRIHIKVGGGEMIDGFDEKLEGLKAGEEKIIDATFPKEYQPAPQLAGKVAQFKVRCRSVKEQAPKNEEK